MTTTAAKPAPAPAPPVKRKRNWRWLRLAGPVAVVLAAFLVTGIIHALQQVGPGDKDYLNPDSRAPIGSARLAEALRDQGVTVRRVTSTYQASTMLWAQPNSTLFVTAPGLTDVKHLTDSRWYPPGSDLVLVRPDDSFLRAAAWPATTVGERWAASAPAPGCDLFGAPAATHKQYYRASGTTCYQGGVVRFQVHPATVTLVGAADPFRNDRLGEHGNRAFALSLLGRHRQVIWLELHEPDRWPTSDGVPVTDRPAPDGPGDRTGIPQATATPDGDDGGNGDQSGDGRTGGSGRTDGDQGQQPREHKPNGAAQHARQQAKAFPPKVWAVVLLVLLAGAAFAAASARRLGTPVTERLPSRVPANETVLGHGRLYQRGGSRGWSLRILTETARRRITDHLGLPPDATDEALAQASGLPVERFTEVFSSGRRLRRDADLVAATKQLNDLMRDVMTEGENQ